MRYSAVPDARARCYDLLTQAHAAGYLEAINAHGRYFLQSDTHADPERALHDFEATAKRGSINRQNSLRIIFRRGLGGFSTNPLRAAAAKREFVEVRHPTAPNALAIMHEDGDRVTRDTERAQ